MFTFQIMSRFPKTHFWMVKPAHHKNNEFTDSSPNNTAEQTSLTETNLVRQSLMRGMSPHRLKFVPRLDKQDHIMRHQEAHLFVDTFTYGAHSTATDALRGVRFSKIIIFGLTQMH